MTHRTPDPSVPNHSVPDPSARERPGDTSDIFVVHASLTTDLHHVRALNEAEALGLWLSGRSTDPERLTGRTLKEPFYHLQVLFWMGETTLEHAHVIRERALERSWGGRLPR
jgi:hypothetical protein